MEENQETALAWELVEHTGKSLFLTGKAGTGKTTFLKRVVAESTKRLAVVAPTGVAAINAEGATIHSFFQISPGQPFIPETTLRERNNKFTKQKQRILASLDLLIIDEISMVRCDLLDAVDNTLRRYRHSYEPFGGVQLLLIGDLFQLTPIVTRDEEQLIARYYDTPYFFSSKALQQVDYLTITLQHVYRQQQSQFIDILNRIRDGQPTAADLRQLNSRCQPQFQPHSNEGYIRLTTHNNLAERYNNEQLDKLASPPHTFKATIQGKFPSTSFPTAEVLTLKVGAQVMFVKNDPAHNYYNGLIAHVAQLDNDGLIQVSLPDGNKLNVNPVTWDNTTYSLNEQTKEITPTTEGTFTQVPLRLAWAITIHKSQGLTFDKTIIQADAAFASGQVYVALSRCRTLQGLVLAAPIRQQAIINDPRVQQFTEKQLNTTQQTANALPQLQEAYFRQLLAELFNCDSLLRTQRYFLRQLEENFSRFNKKLIAEHKQALALLENDICSIAQKWKNTMDTTPAAEIHDQPFIQRVQKACAYFFNQLLRINPLLKRSLEVNSKGQAALKRLQSAYEEWQNAFLTKLNLFHLMEQQTFDIETYLQRKARAVLQAMNAAEPQEDTTPDKTRKRRRPDRRTPKP